MSALPRLNPVPARGIERMTRQIGRCATLALYDELALSPKPGLVTLVDTGSHTDMDARTFMRSLLALRGYCVEITGLGAAGAPFPELQRSGIEAERRMLAATGGINTHRGAIFMLGLLCAAAGACLAAGTALEPSAIRQALQTHWGAALHQRAQVPSRLPGGMAARRFGLRSASQEAAEGFPVLFEVTVPALQRALDQGLSTAQARLDALFHTLAVLDDSNLAHRGGLEGLRLAQSMAREFLAAGGAQAPGALAMAARIGEVFVSRRLSPGGAADTLAAACWMLRLPRSAP